MQIVRFTSTTSPVAIPGLEIKPDTTFVMLQNNNDNDFEISTDPDFALGTGFVIRSKSEIPVPADAMTQILYSRANVNSTDCVFWIA